MHITDFYSTLIKLGGASLEQERKPDGIDMTAVLLDGAKSKHIVNHKILEQIASKTN